MTGLKDLSSQQTDMLLNPHTCGKTFRKCDSVSVIFVTEDARRLSFTNQAGPLYRVDLNSMECVDVTNSSYHVSATHVLPLLCKQTVG